MKKLFGLLLSLWFLIAVAPAEAAIQAVILFDGTEGLPTADPEGRAKAAALFFLELAAPGDFIAIQSFAGDKTLPPVSGWLSSAAERDKLKAALEAISGEGTYTDLNRGLEAALNIFQQLPQEKLTHPVILIFTDGEWEFNPYDPHYQNHDLKMALTSPETEARNTLLKRLLVETGSRYFTVSVLPRLKQLYAPIYNISLPPQPGMPPSLPQLGAQLMTLNGKNIYLDESTSIYPELLQLYAEAAGFKAVPQTLEAFTGAAQKEVKVHPGAASAVFLIPKTARDRVDRITLYDPYNHAYEASGVSAFYQWQSDSEYELVRIKSPHAGPWRFGVQGISPGGLKIWRMEDFLFRVLLEMPQPALVGKNLAIKSWFQQQVVQTAYPSFYGVKVQGQYFPEGKESEAITFSLLDDGVEPDQLAADGVYTAWIKFDNVAPYRLRIKAESPNLSCRSELWRIPVLPLLKLSFGTSLLDLGFRNPGDKFTLELDCSASEITSATTLAIEVKDLLGQPIPGLSLLTNQVSVSAAEKAFTLVFKLNNGVTPGIMNGNIIFKPRTAETETESLPFILTVENYSWLNRYQLWAAFASLGLVAVSLMVILIVLWKRGRRNQEEDLPEEDQTDENEFPEE